MKKSLTTLPPFPKFIADVLGLDLSTRQPILAFFAALDGEPLTPEQDRLFRQYTGRVWRPEGFRQGVLQSGRQGGKSEAVAARLVYRAVDARLAGRRATFVGVAQDHRAGIRALFGHTRRFCERPMLRPLVTRWTADTIELGDVMLCVMPCRPSAWRGLAIDEFGMDEPAHYRSSENIPLDRECWRSALPALAMTGGKLVACSSPYLATGLMHDLHRKHFGNADSDLLYWVSPSTALNPKLDAAFLEHVRDVDPEGARAEIDGEFLAGTSALVDEAVLMAAVDANVTVRPPVAGRQPRAFVDIATGSKAGSDRTALGIAHAEPDGTAVLDLCVSWAPPFSPGAVAKEIANICARYGGAAEVTGDRFAQGFSDDLFRQAGLTYRQATQDKSAIYLAFAAALNTGTVRLLDQPELLREIRGLERRRGTTKDRVDHGRGAGAHDDRANAAAGALWLAARPHAALRFWGGGSLNDPSDVIDRLADEAMRQITGDENEALGDTR